MHVSAREGGEFFSSSGSGLFASFSRYLQIHNVNEIKYSFLIDMKFIQFSQKIQYNTYKTQCLVTEKGPEGNIFTRAIF